MGDVADILGDVATKGGSSKKTTTNSKRKPHGMSREVFQLIGPNALPPLVSSTNVGNKSISKTDKVAPWFWAPFSASSRQTNLMLHHWQRGTTEAAVEYAFSKFNKKCFVIEYTDAEYAQFLIAEKAEEQAKLTTSAGNESPRRKVWTREETDHLILLCNQYDLRWPVIADRWPLKPRPSTVELKARYYKLARLLLNAPPSNASKGTEQLPTELQQRIAQLPKSNFLLSAKAKGAARLELSQFTFDEEKEHKRVEQLDRMFRRNREQEAEEADLLKDLQRVEMRLKRLEKEQENQIARSRGPEGSNSMQRPTFYGAAGPGPETRRMYLRSARLHNLPTPNGVGPRLVKKLNGLLTELDIPIRPMPTGTVCNAYDRLRQDSIKLLSLQRHLWNRRKELAELKGVPLEVVAPMASSVKVSTSRKFKTRKSSSAPAINLANEVEIAADGSMIPKRGRPPKVISTTRKRKQSDAGLVTRKKKKS